MPLTYGAKGQQNTHTIRLKPALIGVADNAWVHKRCRRKTIFVTEIGANQTACFAFDDLSGQSQLGFNLGIAIIEYFFYSPVAIRKISQHNTMFGPYSPGIKRKDITREFLDAFKIRP